MRSGKIDDERIAYEGIVNSRDGRGVIYTDSRYDGVDPIHELMTSPYMIQQKGVDACRRIEILFRKKIPIDLATAEPLPDWALSVLQFKPLGYRTRLQLMFMYAEQIVRTRIRDGRMAIPRLFMDKKEEDNEERQKRLEVQGGDDIQSPRRLEGQVPFAGEET